MRAKSGIPVPVILHKPAKCYGMAMKGIKARLKRLEKERQPRPEIKVWICYKNTVDACTCPGCSGEPVDKHITRIAIEDN